jgi:uncharacterized protein (DUF362 family)
VALETCESDDPTEATARAVEAAGLGAALAGAETVVVKPNLVTLKGPEAGISTDVRVTEAVVRHVQDRLPGAEVVVAEGSSGDITGSAFELYGYREMAERLGIELVDVNHAPSVEVRIESPLSSVKRLRVARVVAEADAVVSVGKLKIHSVAVTTGCCKNMMGVLPGRRWKLVVHAGVRWKLVDLVRAVPPTFGVIDGLYGNEVDEVRPHPVRAGVILAGADPVAVDSVAAAVMGVPWREVPYLRVLHEQGVGCADLEAIEVTCDPEEAACRPFDRSLSAVGLVRTGVEQMRGFLLTRRSAR